MNHIIIIYNFQVLQSMKRIITCLSMLCMLVGLAMASPGPKALAASAETTLYGGISTGMKPVYLSDHHGDPADPNPSCKHFQRDALGWCVHRWLLPRVVCLY